MTEIPRDLIERNGEEYDELAKDDVHTCHDECPCKTGGEPPTDFLSRFEASVKPCPPRPR